MTAPRGPRGRERRGSAPAEREPRRYEPLRLAEVSRSALAHVVELTGRQAAGVTSVRPTEVGWMVEIEVVEDRRVPSSEDILGLYRMELDADGAPLGYQRLSRYRRGRGDRREGPS
jgi:hypothetical protein